MWPGHETNHERPYEDTSAERVHDVLSDAVPDDIMHSFHVLLITHGRAYCTARNPDCDNDVCRTFCDCAGCH